MYILIYLILFIFVISLYSYFRQEKERRNRNQKFDQVVAGRTEPTSLHPFIDPAICLGCGACVPACPEKDVLGIIDGKVVLMTPSHCIGHGACRAACPLDAITLVFGTEKRGVDIPLVDASFETNVPGVYIAGELGGMGLIRNAVTQGRQAMEAIALKIKKNEAKQGVYDVIIVGAGPAGFAASLSAIEHKLNYLTLEQETLGGTVAHYPRGKIVMTQPVVLPIIGEAKFKEISKEKLLQFWQKVEKTTKVKINYTEGVEKVFVAEDGLSVKTAKATYKTQAVLLAIGRRGTPRKLGSIGEDKEKVVYRLVDPEQYRSQHVLVVGGGDSALEAALAVAQVSTTKVTLSYRGEAFNRVKPQNLEKIDSFSKEGKINLILKSNVKEIKNQTVVIDQGGEILELKNDAVLVCAGGVLPTQFLKEIGITVETKYGKQ